MRVRRRSGIATRAALLALIVATLSVWFEAPALAALPDTSNPSLQLDRTIATSPFQGTSTSIRDLEGSAFVPPDSLWLADDNGNSIYEVDPFTGALKRVIGQSAFAAAPRLGGGPAAGNQRTLDFESIAYLGDTLYVFSGPCCSSSVLPTAYRLVRDGAGNFQVESHQPLASNTDHTAAAGNPADGRLWVAKGSDLRTYDYVSNSTGPAVQVPGLKGYLGLGFSDDGADLFVVTNAEQLVRVDWGTRTKVPGWTFGLTGFGVGDSRAVDLIADQFYVGDGQDGRSGPLDHAVFVFDVTGPAGSGPTASFTASPTSGPAPLTVSFTDTSTGGPTDWSWDFGDGATSSDQDPTHTYDVAGTYTARLMVSNASGDSTATRQISVTSSGGPPPPPPGGNLVGNPGFETDTAGWGTSGSGGGVTLSRVTPGRNGSSGAAHVVNGASNKRKCVLNDEPNWVQTTTGGKYSASAWVRGDVAGAQLKLALIEMSGSTTVTGRRATITLSSGWQEVTLSYTPRSAGASSLDLQLFVPRASAPPGTCFYADDISITTS